jgi:hypothetical protein
MTKTPNNSSPHTNRRPHFGFGRRLSGYFGRWILCQRLFPAAGSDDVVLAISGPAAVYYRCHREGL